MTITITAGVEVQSNCLRFSVCKFDISSKNLLTGIFKKELWGDPRQEKIWNDLQGCLSSDDELNYFLSRITDDSSGRIDFVAVDCGYLAQEVYQAVSARQNWITVKTCGGDDFRFKKNNGFYETIFGTDLLFPILEKVDYPLKFYKPDSLMIAYAAFLFMQKLQD
jgi:hypothetical protein